MMFRLAATFLTLTIGLPALADEGPCGRWEAEVEAKDIPCLVRDSIARSFPELAEALASDRIQISKFNDEDSFIKSSFHKGFLRSSDRREYSIDVNPQLHRKFLPVLPRPSLRAVQGAIAHELVHLSNYETASFGGLAGLLKDEVLSKGSYERDTDEQAFVLGYAEGILEFRLWQFDRIGAKASQSKTQKRFYSPDQIREWISNNLN